MLKALQIGVFTIPQKNEKQKKKKERKKKEKKKGSIHPEYPHLPIIPTKDDQ